MNCAALAMVLKIAAGRKDVEEGWRWKAEHVLHPGEGGEPVEGVRRVIHPEHRWALCHQRGEEEVAVMPAYLGGKFLRLPPCLSLSYLSVS